MNDHPKLLQLHFENPANLQETKLVAQRDTCTPDELREWIAELRPRHDQLHASWLAVCCDERA